MNDNSDSPVEIKNKKINELNLILIFISITAITSIIIYCSPVYPRSGLIGFMEVVRIFSLIGLIVLIPSYLLLKISEYKEPKQNNFVPNDTMRAADDKLSIIDGKLFDKFAQKYGPSLKDDLEEWIKLLVSLDPTEQNFDRLDALAWFIFVERQGHAFGEPVQFNIDHKAAEFQEFIYQFNIFSAMRVPFDKWQSVVEILFSTLTKMLQESNMDFNSPDCIQAIQHISKVLSCVTKDPEYDQRYIDLLNGAL